MKFNIKGYGFVALVVLSSYTATAQYRQPTVQHITFNRNVFEVLESADTAEILDPITNEVEWVIMNPNPLPVKFNNMNIYSKGDVQQHPSIAGNAFGRLVLKTLHKPLSVFSDGEYKLKLTNVIISDKGKVVYYNFNGFEKKTIGKAMTDPDMNGTAGRTVARIKWVKIYDEQDEILARIVTTAIEKAPVYKPAFVNGYEVPYRLPDDDTRVIFFIKNGTISYK